MYKKAIFINQTCSISRLTKIISIAQEFLLNQKKEKKLTLASILIIIILEELNTIRESSKLEVMNMNFNFF